MRKAKLTLTVNQELLVQAKKLAKERGASLSGLVEQFFERLLAQKTDIPQDPWVSQMDQLLTNMWASRSNQEEINQAIRRDHDDFEQELIDDLSQKFLK